MFSFVKCLISVKKQNNPKFLSLLKTFHQNLETELKNEDFILREQGDLSSITAKSRPK